jgi:hypothetical protein
VTNSPDTRNTFAGKLGKFIIVNELDDSILDIDCNLFVLRRHGLSPRFLRNWNAVVIFRSERIAGRLAERTLKIRCCFLALRPAKALRLHFNVSIFINQDINLWHDFLLANSREFDLTIRQDATNDPIPLPL